MSLVYFDKAKSSKVSTHALIIGVGQYPHLKGGTSPHSENALGLGQLTSAAISANTFSNWLRERPSNWFAPLGSIELLLSPNLHTDSKSAQINVEHATITNISNAFNRWVARCNTARGNVAIFYFCGHGLQNSFSLLLPQDICSNRQAPWDDAINLDRTHLAMCHCQAQTQCFFIDACRETPIEHAFDPDLTGRRLKSSHSGQRYTRDAPIIWSAPLGDQAFAPMNSVSFFTSALIHALESVGAAYHDGDLWVVETASLAVAVKRLMNRNVMKDGSRLASSTGGVSNFTTRIFEFDKPPIVLADISCVPSAALNLANLSIKKGTTSAHSRKPSAGSWELEITAGRYDLCAAFPGAEYRDVVLSDQTVGPTFFARNLKVA
jgi:hypothetical protein